VNGIGVETRIERPMDLTVGNGRRESLVMDEWVTEVSTMRGHDWLAMARRQEQSPAQENEEPVAELVGFQLCSQKPTSKW